MTITKTELREWKDHPVTEVFLSALDEYKQDAISLLIRNVDEAQLPDDYIRGLIQACEDIVKFDLGDDE